MSGPGSSPGVGATQPADVALPLVAQGGGRGLRGSGSTAGFAPALVVRRVLPGPARADRLYSFWQTVDYMSSTLDGRQLPYCSASDYVDGVGDRLVSVAATGANPRHRFPLCLLLARYVRSVIRKYCSSLVIRAFWTAISCALFLADVLGPEGR